MSKYKLGCNWSPELKKLIMGKLIKIDYIKAGEQSNFSEIRQEMRSLCPILLHGGLGYSVRTGVIDTNSINFQQLNWLIKYCNTPQYGIHIAITQEESYKLFSEEKIFSNMSQIISTFKKKLTVPLLLENTADCLIDRRLYKYIPYVLPDQINRLLHDNDVAFLLDITHAKITAKFHGWDVYGYLNALLLNRVRELHVNGWYIDKNGMLMDAHLAMEEEDFELLEWVLCRTNPEVISLEYSGKKNEDSDDITANIQKFFDYMETKRYY